MNNTSLFATIDLPNNRKIIIRKLMPVEILKRLLDESQKPGFSAADLEEYADFGVSFMPPSHPFKKFQIGLN